MSLDDQCDLVVFDNEYWQWYHREYLKPPRGIIFRFPFSSPQSYGVGPNTLYELSFKVSAMLVENFVRKTFSAGRKSSPLQFHYRQFLLAERSLIEDYGLPPTFARALLPRLNTAHRYGIAYPIEIDLNICTEHKRRNYERYYRLRY